MIELCLSLPSKSCVIPVSFFLFPLNSLLPITFLSLFLLLSLNLTLFLSLFFCGTVSLCLIRTRTRTRTLSLSLPHTHAHSHSLTHSLSLYLSQSAGAKKQWIPRDVDLDALEPEELDELVRCPLLSTCE